RSLGRGGDRLPGELRSVGEGCGEHPWTGRLPVPDRGTDLVGEAAQQLAEDDPGVAVRALERTGGQRTKCYRGSRFTSVHLGVRIERVEPFARGFEGEEEVRAGVGVGHREDVQRVDLLAGTAQRGQAGPGPQSYRRPVERLKHAVPLCPPGRKPSVPEDMGRDRRALCARIPLDRVVGHGPDWLLPGRLGYPDQVAFPRPRLRFGASTASVTISRT